MASPVVGDALGLRSSLKHVIITPLSLDVIRARGRGVVTNLVTYDRHTARPAPDGLFDEAIFGAGASLDPPRREEEERIVEERAIRFGRIVLCEDVPHPMLLGLEVSELPVLPPALRPMLYREGEFLTSDLNVLYREVLVHEGRLRKLRGISAPLPLLASTRVALANAVASLMDNERRAAPARDDAGRVLVSLRGLLRPDATAVAALDDAVGEGEDLSRPLPLRLHRTVSALFAMGLVVTPLTSVN